MLPKCLHSNHKLYGFYLSILKIFCKQKIQTLKFFRDVSVTVMSIEKTHSMNVVKIATVE